MIFRKTNKKDIDDVMRIINMSQNYFKEQGINQWQNNYPNPETIENDIKNKHSYVLLKDEKIVATAAISFDGESTYNKIYNGKWITEDNYAVIHRIAVDNNLKGNGIGGEIIKITEKLCLEKNIKSIKIDTHKDNKSMQRLLQKNNFKYCGVIYLNDGDERIAFEKQL